MSFRSLLILGAAALIAVLALTGTAEIPYSLNYQGRILDTAGNAVPDGIYFIQFRLYDDPTTGIQIWSSGTLKFNVEDGLFSHQLGDSASFPSGIFDNSDSLWLGITIGGDAEIAPRTLLTPTAFAHRSRLAVMADTASYAVTSHTSDTAEYALSSQYADTAVFSYTTNSRDLYHEIVDVSPYSTTTVPFLTRTTTGTVTLYLYGSEFQGAVAAHTHDGVPTHTHDLSGTTNSTSVGHSHDFSGSTNNGGASHSHTGETGTFDLTHNHGVSVNSSGQHRHDFVFTGNNNGSLYLVESGQPTGLATDGTGNAVTHYSVSPTPSNHTHTVSQSNRLTTPHDHTLSIDPETATHNHGFTGTTENDNIAHSHTLSGSIGETGEGLLAAGVNSLATPGNITIYVDGSFAAGPYFGTFATGALDLTSLISTAGEHFVTIVEDGGSGGRLTYNLYVE